MHTVAEAIEPFLSFMLAFSEKIPFFKEIEKGLKKKKHCLKKIFLKKEARFFDRNLGLEVGLPGTVYLASVNARHMTDDLARWL